MRLWKKVVLGLALLGLAGAGAAGAYYAGLPAVETVVVTERDLTRTVEDTGYVQPAQDYDIFTSVGGRVVRLAAATGQAVQKGEVLLVLENPELALQIDAVRAELEQIATAAAGLEASGALLALELAEAERHLARMEQLLAAEAVPPVEHEQALLQVERLAKSLEEHRAQLAALQKQEAAQQQTLARLRREEGRLVVTSPAAGIVLRLPVKTNQTLPPGQLAATIAPLDRLEVKADILTDDLPQVALGQVARITAPALGPEVLLGTVREIYPQAEERLSPLGVTQRRVPVIIALETAPPVLKPGFEVTVAIETAHREGVPAVPRQAIRTTPDSRQAVWVVADGRVWQRWVKTGLSDGVFVEITAGLAAGETIAADAGLDLRDGARVKPPFTND